MKVFLWPSPEEVVENHGIGRIVHAQHKYLPELGITLVGDPRRADIIAAHTQQGDLPEIDVLHLHGLYWTGEPKSGKYAPWHSRANKLIVEAARRAHVLTVPSAWCGEVFRRDMRIVPEIVGHGIDYAEWEPQENLGYALWNKNRNRDVCDPSPAVFLAEQGVAVVSTFAPEGVTLPLNFRVVGAQPHDRMKELVQKAQVYLATVKETYGIGTLEAMACGVPVLGYRHGGTADIVVHGETGYLAEPGNLNDLYAGWNYCLENGERLGENAREYARGRDWSQVIGRYQEVYALALAKKQSEKHRVSIIVTNYNYGKHVAEAVTSAVNQTLPCEVIVVDDGSIDNSADVIRALKDTLGVRTIFQRNSGVAAARNRGIAASQGDYLICLDADDRLDPRYAEVLANALSKDRGMGVAYTGLGLIDENGGIRPNVGWPPFFSWENQSKPGNPPNNCVPCAAMFRKSMWERAGGYRQEYAPGEDTEFFTRGLSVGFTAQLVVDEPLFHYRAHAGSASRTKQYIPIDSYLPWMRDQQYPLGAPLDNAVPIVRSYSEPKVSIIIPLARYHLDTLPSALDSVLGQTMREWEVILVDDGHLSLETVLKPYPFVRVLKTSQEGSGSAVARNLGLMAAKAPLSLFLDADDFLMPEALLEMCTAYAQAEGRYIYTDWLAVLKGEINSETVPDYDPQAVLHAPQHAVTVLISTEAAQSVKFNPNFFYLEDWDFFARCAIAGVQGQHLSKALVGVRMRRDRKTAKLSAQQEILDQTAKAIYDQFGEYREGAKQMGGCCGGGGGAIIAAKEAIFGRSLTSPIEEVPLGQFAPEVVRVEFIGASRGASSYGGPGITPSGRRYRGGNNPHDRYQDADPRDIVWLEGSSMWRKVSMPIASSEAASQETALGTLERISGLEIDPVSEPEPEPESDPIFLVTSKPKEKKKRGRPRRKAAVDPGSFGPSNLPNQLNAG